MIKSSCLRDTFNYEIDVIVPNADTNFNDLKDLFNQYQYYLLTDFGLNELFDDLFIEAFIKNGSIYMLSLSTHLDTHDCVALLPNGNLVLNLLPATFERVPIEAIKTTPKTSSIPKYEIHIDLTNLEKRNVNLLKEIFESFKFSFYFYWKPNEEIESQINVFETIKNYFGENRILKCANRFENQTYAVDSAYVNQFISNNDLKSIENWESTLTFIGSLINQIELSHVFDDLSNKTNSDKCVSICRLRGFYPNSLVDDIQRLTEQSIYKKEKVIVLIHGFKDSPVSLYDDLVKLNQITRSNIENFVSRCIDKSQSNNQETLYYFYDFKKPFFIIKQ